MKEKIPVYDICALNKGDEVANADILADRLSAYLGKHYHHLHSPHRHSFFHLILFTKGKGTHTIDFSQYDVKPFQAYFMIPGQVHSWHFETIPDGYIINFSESFFKSFLLHSNYLERFIFFSGMVEDSVWQLPSEIHKEAVYLFEAIINSLNTDQNNTIDLARTYLLQLFILIDNSIIKTHKKTIPQQKHVLLNSFKRLIEVNYKTLRLPKEYADLLYVTPNHLNALCQDLTGKTAGEMIRDRILLEAKRLLTNVNMTVAEISIELNFQDSSYFNRFFKKSTGLTPNTFRNNLQTQK